MAMTTTQYNAIMTELRRLDAKTDSLREETRQEINELQKSIQAVIRWVMGLFVAALLVNGPVIGQSSVSSS